MQPRLKGRKTTFTYHCTICGQQCYNEKADLSRSEPILDANGNPVLDKKEKPGMKQITGRGLGTWHCPTQSHEPTKVKRQRATIPE